MQAAKTCFHKAQQAAMHCATAADRRCGSHLMNNPVCSPCEQPSDSLLCMCAIPACQRSVPRGSLGHLAATSKMLYAAPSITT